MAGKRLYLMTTLDTTNTVVNRIARSNYFRRNLVPPGLNSYYNRRILISAIARPGGIS